MCDSVFPGYLCLRCTVGSSGTVGRVGFLAFFFYVTFTMFTYDDGGRASPGTNKLPSGRRPLTASFTGNTSVD